MGGQSGATVVSSFSGEAWLKGTQLVDFDMLDLVEPSAPPVPHEEATCPGVGEPTGARCPRVEVATPFEAAGEDGLCQGRRPPSRRHPAAEAAGAEHAAAGDALLHASKKRELRREGRPASARHPAVDSAGVEGAAPSCAGGMESDGEGPSAGLARRRLIATLRQGHPRLSSALDGAPAVTSDVVPRVEPKARVLILYDRRDQRCRALARALRVEYGHLCDFVDHTAAPELLRVAGALAELPRRALVRRGGLSAVLPSGVFLSFCEEDTTILAWELDSLWTLTFPTPQASRALEGACFLRPPRPGAWREATLLRKLACALGDHKFAVIDDALREVDMEALREAARALYRNGAMRRGAVSTDSVYEVMAQKHALLSGTGTDGEPRQWSGRGNFMVSCSDADPREPRVGLLSEETDALVSALKSGCGRDDVSARLAPVTFREDTMVAAYPAASRARYPKHLDNDRHAVLTAILYLNKGWTPEDGGQLRLYMPGMYCNDVKAKRKREQSLHQGGGRRRAEHSPPLRRRT
uniref:Prolyl 4-hydroxylase alpha subunit domain-containing protein n=1 Tax=Alexandrium monilatum TaxID=311494 RepID=A0A7S4Q8E3_9DINO